MRKKPATPSVRLMLVLLVALTGVARDASAGPQLICHSYEIEDARSLPWGAGWEGFDRAYDVRRLPGDVARLLEPTTPVLVRMETMRRATVYAAHNPGIVDALLTTVLSRARAAGGQGQPSAMARFDAGYLVESFRQALRVQEWPLYRQPNGVSRMLQRELAADSFGQVKLAIAQTDGNPEMEFAAALIATGIRGQQAASQRHLLKAAAGAKPGSLLAANLQIFLAADKVGAARSPSS